MEEIMSQKQHPVRLQLEVLEDRLAPAVTEIKGGWLYIYGSNTTDVVHVGTNGVLLDGVRLNYSPSQYYNGVVFYGNGGADRFTNSTSKTSVVYGGEGNDTLNGGYGRNYLYGEGGYDVLDGRTGSYNVFYGGAGDDRLYGGNYADYLVGGMGSDQLYGYGGNDYLWGGDTNRNDSERDYFDGGAGTDTIYYNSYDTWTAVEYGRRY
jgi:Ca2+-binding RTX toxin-like protein